MGLKDKLFTPALLILIAYFFYIAISGENLRKEMVKNKSEVFDLIKIEFGKPIEIYDTSKELGYAFLYFDLGKQKNYELRLEYIGFVKRKEVFCYKNASLSYVPDKHKFILSYVYPDANCD